MEPTIHHSNTNETRKKIEYRAKDIVLKGERDILDSLHAK